MKVLIILGSLNPKGQTARATDAFKQGLKSKEIAHETLFLPPLKIERCRQCEDSGWGICRTEGTCVIEDEFAMLVDKIRNSDAVVLATPVYIHDLSESMLAFLNRLYRICKHTTGSDKVYGKTAIGICVAGGSGNGATACAVRLEKVLTFCGFQTADIIPIRRQNLDIKLAVLKETAKRMITLAHNS